MLARTNLPTAHAPPRPSGEADGQLPQAAPQHQPADGAAAGAERHPHADLLRPRRHRVGDDGVEADRGQRERDERQDAEQRPEDAERPRRLRQHLVDGPRVGDGLIGIDLLHLAADRGDEPGRVEPAAQDHRGAARADLLDRHVDHVGEVAVARVAVPDVRADADDREPPRVVLGVLVRHADAAADRIRAGEVAGHEPLVDDRHLGALAAVAGVEGAAAADRHADRVEERRADDHVAGFEPLAAAGVGPAVDQHLAGPQPERRHARRHRRGVGAGQAGQPRRQPLEELRPHLRRRVVGARQVDAHRRPGDPA